MGYKFALVPAGTANTAPTTDWSSSTATPYNSGTVDKIVETTTARKEITSIPSPFARIELVKEAFAKVVPGTVAQHQPKALLDFLHGDSIYHKYVSDTLDVAQIFFNYASMQHKVEILVWDRAQCLNALTNSNNDGHKTLGSTLDMFLQQDSQGKDPYNFKNMTRIYILRYIGPGHRRMHILGATSPATLFFSTANDENSIHQHLCFGTDYAFDNHYASLDQRDPEFIKYLFAQEKAIPQFNTTFPEVNKYLDAVYTVLPNDLKTEVDDIRDGKVNFLQDSCTPITFNRGDVGYGVEVNGQTMYSQIVSVAGHSDFEIKATKTVNGQPPLVLPITNGVPYNKMQYFGGPFGAAHHVPSYDSAPVAVRRLPGIGVAHPYLTISDFLDDKILRLPAPVDGTHFFDGHLTCRTNQPEGFLPPILPAFFDYFTVDDLTGLTHSGKKMFEMRSLSGDGVQVTLRIPTHNTTTGDSFEIEYTRIYYTNVNADKGNNKGAIVQMDSEAMVALFPPVQYATPAEAHYRVALINRFALCDGCRCEGYNEQETFFTPDYVVRNTDSSEDLKTKTYIIDGKTFACLRVTIVASTGNERTAAGLVIPKFSSRNTSGSLSFAIDLGTSNTHIEYKKQDPNAMPQVLQFDSSCQLMSCVCAPSDKVKKHLWSEYVPAEIGGKSDCHLPMRTVLCIDRNNTGLNGMGTGDYTPLGNAAPAWMYNTMSTGSAYNDYVPNLKWSSDQNMTERLRYYIESLLLVIRARVLYDGGDLAQTTITWFYPISMSTHRVSLLQGIWREAYQKYFDNNSEPVAITESIAPYSYFQQVNASVTDVVTIDIGGGTTDIVVAKTDGPQLITSMRFAADAIFGNTLVQVQPTTLNGILRQVKNYFLTNLHGFNELESMFAEMTAGDCGRSAEVAAFLFSLADNAQVNAKGMQRKLDFNALLRNDGSQRIVIYIFYTALIYHLAHLMHAKRLDAPRNIAFSGNGSKVLQILSTDKNVLQRLTTIIFTRIYNDAIHDISIILNEREPKEATCKGGLLLRNNIANVEQYKSVLLGTTPTTLVTRETYRDVPRLYDKVVSGIRDFVDFITLTVPQDISLKKNFGIDSSSVALAVKSFDDCNLKAFIESGIDVMINSGDVIVNDIVEESLFFYPIIGVMNDISAKICDQANNGNSNNN